MDERASLSDRVVTHGDYRPRGAWVRGLLGRDWKIAFPFVLPMVLLMVGLILWPFISAIMMSTTAFNFLTGETTSVGLRNYERLLSNSDYVLSLQNTIVFTFWSLAIKFVVGMTIAMILHSRIPARDLIAAIMLLPWIVPEIVTALAWKSIYDPIFGGLNPILQGLGVIQRPMGWLSDPDMAMGSIIAVNVWKGIPFYTLLLLAGLKAIDNEQLEAAEVDGANAVQRFRYVTLPGLRYVIIVRRRAGRGDAPLFDPRLREGHRLPPVRSRQRHRAERGAAHGHPHRAAGPFHAPRRPQCRRSQP